MSSQYYPRARGAKYASLVAAIFVLAVPVAAILFYTAEPLLARHAFSTLGGIIVGIIVPLALLAVGLVLSFLPSIISAKRVHPHTRPILIANLAQVFGGGAIVSMTVVLIAPLVLLALGVAWVGLLVWSVWPQNRQA